MLLASFMLSSFSLIISYNCKFECMQEVGNPDSGQYNPVGLGLIPGGDGEIFFFELVSSEPLLQSPLPRQRI